MTDKKEELLDLSDPAKKLLDLQEANQEVVKLLNDFLENPPAADTVTLRDYQRHQHNIVLQIVLNQQKSIHAMHTALAQTMAFSNQTRKIAEGIVILLKNQGITPNDSADDSVKPEANDEAAPEPKE